jgi:hypothetical protein
LQKQIGAESWSLTIQDIDAYADHIAKFSLTAIKAMRKDAERKKTI